MGSAPWTPEQEALIAELDQLIAELGERLRLLLSQTEHRARQVMQARPLELLPLRATLSELDPFIDQLGQRLEDTWTRQLEPRCRQQGEALLTLAFARQQDTRDALRHQVEGFKLDLEGECLRAMYPAVQAALATPIRCSDCGASLRARVPHQPERLDCPRCGASNCLVPPPLVAMYFHNAELVFPSQETFALRVQIHRARRLAERERRVHGWLVEPAASQAHREQLEARYWRRYAEVKAAFLGQPVDEAFIEARMRWFRESCQKQRRAQRNAVTR